MKIVNEDFGIFVGSCMIEGHKFSYVHGGKDRASRRNLVRRTLKVEGLYGRVDQDLKRQIGTN